MGPEQKALFRETQAVMSLLEGFSDYVMDEVGRDLVPDVARISAAVPRAPDEADAVRAVDAPADRHGPQDRAVQEGRAVRPGHRRPARTGGADAAVGRARRPCRATARSRRPSAGSPASSTDRPDERRIGPAGRSGHRAAAARRRPSRSARSSPRATAQRDLERIRAAAPGARIVTVSVEGLADGPLDDVEVMLRGWLSSDAFDRILARAPRLQLGPLGDVRRGAGADPGRPRARHRRDQRPRRLQPADRRVRADDDPGRQPPAAAAPRAPARADVAAARGRRAARRDRRDRRAGLDRPGGRRARDGVRLPGRRRPAPRRRGRDAERRRTTTAAPLGELHARPRRRPGDAARAARRVRLHRPRRAADARDRGDDQRRDAGAWSSPARGSSTSPAAG